MVNGVPISAPAPIIVYEAAGQAVEVRLDAQHDTVWLTQEQMCAVFGVQKAAISKHLKNIYQDGELEPAATVSILETVRSEGQRKVKRQIEHYNLDASISVWYRVNSPATLALGGKPSTCKRT